MRAFIQHFEDSASAKSPKGHQQDLDKIFWQGPDQDHARMKIGTNVLRERAQLKCTCTCRRNDFMRFFFMGMPQAKAGTTALREPLRSKCAWTCQNNNFTIFYIILRENFVAKCGKPRRGQTFCASFFRRNAHGHVTRTISSKHTAHPKQEQMRGKL